MRRSLFAVHPGNEFVEIEYVYEFTEDAAKLLTRQDIKLIRKPMYESSKPDQEERNAEYDQAFARALASGGSLVEQRYHYREHEAYAYKTPFVRKKELTIALCLTFGPALLILLYLALFPR